MKWAEFGELAGAWGCWQLLAADGCLVGESCDGFDDGIGE